MNFIQFVELIVQGTSVQEVAANYVLKSGAEEIGMYMTPEVSLTSELAFFDLEQVAPNIFITVNGIAYESFFSATELADLIPEYENFLGAMASPIAIAEAILHYHEYDA